jgi:putative transposase
MPYPLRASIAGGLTHLTVRGVDRRLIFLDDYDRGAIVTGIARATNRYEWSLHAWAVLGNHFHLLVDGSQPKISSGMQLINAIYARRYNARYGRRGHLVEERFGSYVIRSEAHYFRTIRYIVLNPVRAGLCDRPADWPWSSYRATAGLERAPAFLDVEAVWVRFGPTPAAAQAEFAAFIGEGLPGRVA